MTYFFNSTRQPANDGGSFLFPPVNNNLSNSAENLVVFLRGINGIETQHVSVMRTWTDSSFRTQSPLVFRLHVAAQRGVPECKQLINIMTALMSSSGAKMKTLTGKVCLFCFFLGGGASLVICVAMETVRSWGHCLLPSKSNMIGALNPHQVFFRGVNQPRSFSPGGHCGYKQHECCVLSILNRGSNICNMVSLQSQEHHGTLRRRSLTYHLWRCYLLWWWDDMLSWRSGGEQEKVVLSANCCRIFVVLFLFVSLAVTAELERHNWSLSSYWSLKKTSHSSSSFWHCCFMLFI